MANLDDAHKFIRIVSCFKLEDSQIVVSDYIHQSEVDFEISVSNYCMSIEKEDIQLLAISFQLKKALDTLESLCSNCNIKEKNNLVYVKESIDTALEFLNIFLSKDASTTMDSETECDNTIHTSPQIIKGVRKLAHYLGICVSSAQNIVNDRILLDEKIQYRCRNCWYFDVDKLNKYIHTHPEGLSSRVSGHEKNCVHKSTTSELHSIKPLKSIA